MVPGNLRESTARHRVEHGPDEQRTPNIGIDMAPLGNSLCK